MANRQSFQNKKILIIDDEEDLREIISFEFELIGFEIAVAENGRKGFDTFEREKPDVILSDIRMPGGDGIELLRKIKALDPFQPPVLLMTGFADLSDEEAYSLGADFIFPKPFESADLVRGVSMMLMDYRERLALPSGIDPHNKITLTLPSLDHALAHRDFAIGRTGLFVHTEQVQKIGSSVTINISFSEGPLKNVVGDGFVRWARLGPRGARKQGLGIELRSLNPEAIEVFYQYIQQHRPQASIPSG